MQEVRDAFLRRAQEVHPDHGGNKEAFHQLKRDYENALEYGRRPKRSTSAIPQQATIHAVGTKPRRKPSRFLWRLLGCELLAVVGCFFSESIIGFVSITALCILTLLLAGFALAKMPREYSTIIFFFTVLMPAMLMVGLYRQEEYSRVYRMDTAAMDTVDWLMAASPFYFLLLWIGGFCGWSVSWTKGNS